MLEIILTIFAFLTALYLEIGDYDIKPTDKYCKFCGAEMMQVEGEDE